MRNRPRFFDTSAIVTATLAVIAVGAIVYGARGDGVPTGPIKTDRLNIGLRGIGVPSIVVSAVGDKNVTALLKVTSITASQEPQWASDFRQFAGDRLVILTSEEGNTCYGPVSADQGLYSVPWYQAGEGSLKVLATWRQTAQAAHQCSEFPQDIRLSYLTYRLELKAERYRQENGLAFN